MLTPEEKQLLEEFKYFLHPVVALFTHIGHDIVSDAWNKKYKDDSDAIKRLERVFEIIKREGGMPLSVNEGGNQS